MIKLNLEMIKKNNFQYLAHRQKKASTYYYFFDLYLSELDCGGKESV